MQPLQTAQLAQKAALPQRKFERSLGNLRVPLEPRQLRFGDGLGHAEDLSSLVDDVAGDGLSTRVAGALRGGGGVRISRMLVGIRLCF